MFSLLRCSRAAVGRALAAKPAYTPARSFTAPAWSSGANVGNGVDVTPAAAATAALVSARARFFATSRASAFAAHAHAAGEAKTKSASGTKKGGAKKASAAGGRKAAAKKGTKGKKASAAKGGKARTGAKKGGRVRARKVKKVEAPKIFKKDVTPPFKAPGSSWSNFATEFIRARSEGTPVYVAMTEAAKVWRDMTPDVKAKYAPSREAIAEYQAKKAEWLKALPMRYRKKYKETRRQPAKSGTQSPYSLFTKEHYALAPGTTFREKASAMGQMWRDLSDSEREVYRQRSIEDKRAHRESQASASASP